MTTKKTPNEYLPMGRPPLPKSQRRVGMSIKISPEARQIAEREGGENISRWIEGLILATQKKEKAKL